MAVNVGTGIDEVCKVVDIVWSYEDTLRGGSRIWRRGGALNKDARAKRAGFFKILLRDIHYLPCTA